MVLKNDSDFSSKPKKYAYYKIVCVLHSSITIETTKILVMQIESTLRCTVSLWTIEAKEYQGNTNTLFEGLSSTAIKRGYIIEFSNKTRLNYYPSGKIEIEFNRDYQTEKEFPKDTIVPWGMDLYDLIKNLLRDGIIKDCRFKRHSEGEHTIPIVPICGNDMVLLTTREEVNASYDNPKVFWSAKWDEKENIGEKILLSWGLSLNDNISYLEKVNEDIWDMARAAKHGLTKYVEMYAKPGEERFFIDGDPKLFQVGYNPKDKLVEYSCYVEHGEHILPFEINKLIDIMSYNELEDGRPVDVVRVVFDSKDMAVSEKRPLLDNNIQVYFMNDDGELEQLTE